MKDTRRITWYELTIRVRPLEGPTDWENVNDRVRRAIFDGAGPCLFDGSELKRLPATVDHDT